MNAQTRKLVKAAYCQVASLPPIPQLITGVNKLRHHGRSERRLEIGPGSKRLPGFETLNIVPGPAVDYIADAARKLPFPAGTFDVIYASHILEHIPWFQALPALQEWVRALKPGGALEIWVPDALKICEALVRYERDGIDESHLDGWYKFNPEQDPCKWAAGRLYTYGDGSGRLDHPNWHRGLFTPRYLRELFEKAGLENVRQMDRSEVRGNDHGWINLGMRGVKPSSPSDRNVTSLHSPAPSAKSRPDAEVTFSKVRRAA